MTDTTRLTDYGAKIEAVGQRDRCQAFDQYGDRCPCKRQSKSRFCPDCDATRALITTDELTADSHTNGGHYTATAVKNGLRDNYGFPARDALILASGSVLSTCYVLEGRLAWAAKAGENTFTVRGHEYPVERGRELLEQVRSRVTSTTFREKWASACLVVPEGRSRCSSPRQNATVCGFHQDLDEDEFRLDEHLSVYGPDGGGE